MRLILVGLVGIFAGCLGFAETIENIEFSPTTRVGNNELKLNGLGLRKVTKFGLDFKVYVAGLYTKSSATDAPALLASAEPKQLKMVFVRRVQANDLNEAYKNGLYDNCKENCDEAKAGLKELTAIMPEMLDKSTIVYTFTEDGVEYEIKGRKEAKGTIKGKAFSKALLATFIGEKPPTEKLKAGLLGAK